MARLIFCLFATTALLCCRGIFASLDGNFELPAGSDYGAPCPDGSTWGTQEMMLVPGCTWANFAYVGSGKVEDVEVTLLGRAKVTDPVISCGTLCFTYQDCQLYSLDTTLGGTGICHLVLEAVDIAKDVQAKKGFYVGSRACLARYLMPVGLYGWKPIGSASSYSQASYLYEAMAFSEEGSINAYDMIKREARQYDWGNIKGYERAPGVVSVTHHIRSFLRDVEVKSATCKDISKATSFFVRDALACMQACTGTNEDCTAWSIWHGVEPFGKGVDCRLCYQEGPDDHVEDSEYSWVSATDSLRVIGAVEDNMFVSGSMVQWRNMHSTSQCSARVRQVPELLLPDPRSVYDKCYAHRYLYDARYFNNETDAAEVGIPFITDGASLAYGDVANDDDGTRLMGVQLVLDDDHENDDYLEFNASTYQSCMMWCYKRYNGKGYFNYSLRTRRCKIQEVPEGAKLVQRQNGEYISGNPTDEPKGMDLTGLANCVDTFAKNATTATVTARQSEFLSFVDGY